jgi:putative molybdopterin biosynthesis protein
VSGLVKRQIYLENTPLKEALEKWKNELTSRGVWKPFSSETVPVDDALGRVTDEAVTARISSPTYHSSAMDGIAVRFLDTLGASEGNPKRLTVGKDVFYVDTGNPLPEGMDAVIMIEDVAPCGEGEIEIIAPATPYQHVRTLGEDMVATELVLPENHKIRPMDTGALLACGMTRIKVRRLPRIAVIPTGDELVQPGSEVPKGKIIEFNSRILCGMVREWGGRAQREEIVPDNFEALKAAISKALTKADMVVVNAGSSAGKEDYTVHVLREMGEVLVHGVSMRPGKPVILSLVEGKPVVGIPGYPVSAALTFELFAKPVIYAFQGLIPPEYETVKALLSRPIASVLGQEEFLRVKVGVVGDRCIVTPIARGAGMLMSLVQADGILRIPGLCEGVGARQEVTVQLLRSRSEIEKTLVCIGSHDNSLDILSSLLKKRYPEMSLSSAHVGSMGGLIAIKRGEAHLAGTHLLDEETGEYNIPFVRRLLSDQKVVVMNLVYREQGLLVQPGNPKGIHNFHDLCRDDVAFINRQKGSGTRLLTDKHFREAGIDTSAVRGYEREEYTHMGVASAVAGGTADAGVGILAAARALSLEFLPLARERYDFVIPSEFYDSASMEKLLRILREDQEFKENLIGLGGYDLSDMGKVLYRDGDEK